jgi:hypothetical protein
MGSLLGGKSDSGAAQRAADAEARAAQEKAALEAKQLEERQAAQRGLRGRRGLLSSAGELGFSQTLG